MNICGYYPESINEGEGLRASIFISGCRHYCKGCFSPATWSFKYGEPFTLERQRQIIQEIAANPVLSGVSILGGDPFFSAAEVSCFIDLLREEAGTASVWIYSGFTYEELAGEAASSIGSSYPEATCDSGTENEGAIRIESVGVPRTNVAGIATTEARELLSRCQVLVDGRFVEELRDPSLLYRGSSNQRLIDVQASLLCGKTVLWEPAIVF